MGARLAPASLLAGIAAAVGTIAVYQWWWGLLLGAAATLALAMATPAGWATRLPLACGFDGAVALLAVPREEGDYLVASTGAGYTVLALALAVLMLAIATLPRPVVRPTPRPTPRRTEGKAPSE
jgi:hypothetical protein